MTHAKLLGAALISTSLAGAMPALAEGQGFGEEGQLILSVDRLFGLAITSTKVERTAVGSPITTTTTTSNTTVGLLWPGGPSPYQIPRLAFDVNVASGFTVGGSIGFVSFTGTNKVEANGVSTETDAPTATLFAFAPRIGYALAVSDQFAFWPRIGVTYYNISTKDENPTATPPNTDKDTVSGLGLDVEPIFVFSPVSHFGITAGPILDIPLSGSSSSERTPLAPGATNPPDAKVKFLNYGITVGVLGYF